MIYGTGGITVTDNDLAVMAAYGFDKKITVSECVAELMKMYQKLTENK